MTREELGCDANFLNFPEAVRQYINENADSWNRYVGWVETHLDDVVVRMWAFRRFAGGEIKYVEVQRTSPAVEMAARRNCYFTQMGGYHPVYEPKTVTSTSGYWGYGFTYFDATTDWNKWYTENEMGVWCTIINTGDIFKTDKYEYCGFSGAQNLVEYLRLYNKNHDVEYFGKLGLKFSQKLYRLAKKDKQFMRFLRDNAEDIQLYGPEAAVFAYKNKIPVETARRIWSKENAIKREMSYIVPELKGTSIDRIRLRDYFDKNNVEGRNYNDYLKAIKGLGLNLEDTKNIYPKDFQRMHDLRIREYEAHKAEIDKKARNSFMRILPRLQNASSGSRFRAKNIALLFRTVRRI